MDSKDLIDSAGVLGSFGGAFLIGGLWLRRKLSRDGVEIRKDKAEESIIKHLEDERDKLKVDKTHLIDRIVTIEKERNDAQMTVSKLSVEVQYLTEKVEELKVLTEKLLSKLEVATAELHNYAIQNAKLEALEKLELTNKHPSFKNTIS